MKRDHLFALLSLICIVAGVGKTCAAEAEDALAHPATAQRYQFEMVNLDPVEHGQRLSAVLGCVGCHLPDLTGEDWSDPELGVLWTANLTHSAANYSAEKLATMIAGGTRPDRALIDMPSFLFSELHPDDVAALVSYLKSLPIKGEKHPEPTIGPALAKQIESGEFKDSVQLVTQMRSNAPPDLGPRHAFARFILRATCVECHGMNLEGSTEPMSEAPSRPSLRVIAAYSEEEFATLMRTGKAIGDRELNMMSGVARWRYSQFSEKELKAVYDYLIEFSRRPVNN